MHPDACSVHVLRYVHLKSHGRRENRPLLPCNTPAINKVQVQQRMSAAHRIRIAAQCTTYTTH